ncbi:MAG: NAD(P)/FAD-dependent oxidoreductase [Hyphomonadaceae bacterium]|nr:NAD(P)/FAD-dependent oxidoreductase [Hyphomonadaceae bacterium]
MPDVVVIGAGAAGMMCAIEAARRGRDVLVLDHAHAAGEKIRISGGGRCNFTNIHAAPDRFLSDNPGFCISALKRYTPADFIAVIDRAGIAWHEKTLGQLFCDGSAVQVVDLLKSEMARHGAALRLSTSVRAIAKEAGVFRLQLDNQELACASVVIATGGKSIPKMGATGFAYDIAAQFGLNVIPPRAGLVPFTLQPHVLEKLAPLSGVSADVRATCNNTSFEEAMLFTHRGLSGPAILQISSYWREGDEIALDLAPRLDLFAALRRARQERPRQTLQTVLAHTYPKRLAQLLPENETGAIADYSDAALRRVVAAIRSWRIKPAGTEGWRTAEVTLGGVDTRGLDSRTMQAKSVPGLYFIGECVDVTGWLGGYNFQWAWASGWAAGQVV